jgi:hypothetical protein
LAVLAISYLLTAYLYHLQKSGRLQADIRFKTYASAGPKPGNLYFAYQYEAMTKGGSHMVLISDSTRAMLTSPVADLLPVEEKEIRGRQGRVAVWSFDNSRAQSERDDLR